MDTPHPEAARGGAVGWSSWASLVHTVTWLGLGFGLTSWQFGTRRRRLGPTDPAFQVATKKHETHSKKKTWDGSVQSQSSTGFLGRSTLKTISKVLKILPRGRCGEQFPNMKQRSSKQKRFWRFWRLNWTWAPSQSSTGLAPSHLHFWSWQAPSSLQLGWHLKTWKIWHQKPQAQSKDRKAQAQSFYSFVTCNASALILLKTKVPKFSVSGMFTAHVHAYKPQLTTGRYNDSMQHLSPLPTHPLEQGQLNNHHTTLFSLLPTLHLSDRSAMLQGTSQPSNTDHTQLFRQH